MSWIDLKNWLEWKDENKFNEFKVKQFGLFFYEIYQKQIPSQYLLNLNEIDVYLQIHHYLANFFKNKGFGFVWIENNEPLALILFSYSKELFCKDMVVFHQTGISDKAPKTLVFELMKKTKQEIKKLTNKNKYFMANLKPVAHNKRFKKWFEKEIGQIDLMYETYFGVSNGKN